MATTLITDPSHNMAGPSGAYPQVLMAELDFRDNRYPSIASPSSRRCSAMLFGSSGGQDWDCQQTLQGENEDVRRRPSLASQLQREFGEHPQGPRDRGVEYMHDGGVTRRPTTGDASSITARTIVQSQSDARPLSPQSQNRNSSPTLFQSQNLFRTTSSASAAGPSADIQSLRSLHTVSQQSQILPQAPSPLPPLDSSNSLALPPGAARGPAERYSLDDRPDDDRTLPRGLNDTRSASPLQIERSYSSQSQPRNSNVAPGLALVDRPTSLLTSSPRHPSLSLVGANANVTGSAPGPFLPLSASPAYSPPISPNMRAYAQQPTYVSASNVTTPALSPSASSQARLQQPILQPIQPQRVQPVQEEICVECAMRDQDMADVDVTTPGVWDRESDILYHELLQRELDEDVNGGSSMGSAEDSGQAPRPRARGGRLTEQNLKLWLTMNPREPTSRQQTLNTYVTSQRGLLEAEALAHARAMQESKQLDNRMRDTYSQLRRSAYDTGSSALPTDDLGGVRIKPPVTISATSPYSPAAYNNNPTHAHDVHGRSQSREITLLENGMIVEHVDVRKEEKEARERRRKEERRARKSSRSSVMDVTSLYSVASYPASPLPTDSGVGLGQNRPHSRYSQMTGSSVGRPTSVLTAPLEGPPGSPRPNIPRAYSQASFSDAHSLASPKRPRFLGFKHLTGWRSQESLAPSGMSIMSGSVVNMHVALAREDHRSPYSQTPIDLNTPTRQSHIWPPPEAPEPITQPMPEGKSKKKSNGLAKIWRMVTGSTKHDASASRGLPNPHERNEDDMPLAPPPPLSYLVDRTLGDGIALGQNGGPKQPSTPSLQSSVSPKMMGVPPSPGMSPSTAPSSMLPSPVSSRRSGHDMLDPLDSRKNSGGFEEPVQQFQIDSRADEVLGDGTVRTAVARNVHSVISEPDIRTRMSQHMEDAPQARPPLPSIPASRPASVMSRDKSLPPLPGEQRSRSGTLNDDVRPRSVFSLNYRPPGSAPAHDFLPPQAAFRSADVRRQSFGGTASHPNLVIQTIPPPHATMHGGYQSFGPRYDEFGTSRRSLGRVESPTSIPPTPKRKSKFGFSSLLGKKHSPPERPYDGLQQFPMLDPSNSDVHVDILANGYSSPTGSPYRSFHSGPRMSVASRKALDELVPQDSEFVAYRYPSSEQRIDLLR